MYHAAVEREILLTGIGGQGIQLAARTLAEAAIADGRRVQLFASYGGMMRGGNSDSFLVIADDNISSPPVVGSAWAALVMHHEHAAAVWPKLRADSLAVINHSVVDPTCRPSDAGVGVVEVAAQLLEAGETLLPDPVAPHRFIPQALEDICLQAMEKHPDHRYLRMQDMMDAIQKFRADTLLRGSV